MKRAIVTRADDNVRDWVELTHPLLKKYAQKCDADFIVLSHDPPFLSNDNYPHWRILKVYELFEKYDRILMLDTDMLINKNCPDLFKIVPEDHIGCVFEDVGTRTWNRRQQIVEVQEFFDYIGWTSGYMNEGIVMLSKQHKDIFFPHYGRYWNGAAGSQTHFMFNIQKLKFKIFELNYRWNHMTMFSEPWNESADRFKSHIIHYAGRGIFEPHLGLSRIQQARKDYETIYGKIQEEASAK